jgi:hypothetical protein
MCLEFAKDRMSMFEVRRALTELVVTTKDEEELEHYKELSEMSDEQLKNHAEKVAKEA